jgi:hypothetical protein
MAVLSECEIRATVRTLCVHVRIEADIVFAVFNVEARDWRVVADLLTDKLGAAALLVVEVPKAKEFLSENRIVRLLASVRSQVPPGNIPVEEAEKQIR